MTDGSGCCGGLRAPVPRVARGALAIALAALVAAALLLALPTASLAEEGASARDDAAGIGLVDFTRYQKGAARAVGEVDLGYRYPLPEGADVVVLVTDGRVFIYVGERTAVDAGLDITDETDRRALLGLVEELDEECSRGGELVSEAAGDREVVFMSDPSVTDGTYTYRFSVEVDGRLYCSVQPAALAEGESATAAAEAAGLDLSEGALWCDGARLVGASAVPAEADPGPFEALGSFLAGVDLRPFWVSLKTSAAALAVTFVLGLAAARGTMGSSGRLKGLLDSVFTIPMVLPPTVCGFLLLLIFGQATPVGRWLIDHGVSIVFTWEAAVISAAVVSFPIMYRTALGAFESLDGRMLDAARTLGWSEGRIFFRIMMPLCWPGIAAGTVLAFARAMGEFGCTLFFAGNYAGVTQTIPIAIYFQWMSGNTDVALFWVVVVILFSFAVVLAINLYTARSQRYRERGSALRRGSRSEPPAASEASAGGDALRIDREELRALIDDTARACAPSEGGN